jgi:hypothetical protein
VRRMVRLQNEVDQERQSAAAPTDRDPALAGWKTRRNPGRRHAHDLHWRLEHKRQEIEHERRVFVRRWMDRMPAGGETPRQSRGLTP